MAFGARCRDLHFAFRCKFIEHHGFAKMHLRRQHGTQRKVLRKVLRQAVQKAQKLCGRLWRQKKRSAKHFTRGVASTYVAGRCCARAPAVRESHIKNTKNYVLTDLEQSKVKTMTIQMYELECSIFDLFEKHICDVNAELTERFYERRCDILYERLYERLRNFVEVFGQTVRNTLREALLLRTSEVDAAPELQRSENHTLGIRKNIF